MLKLSKYKIQMRFQKILESQIVDIKTKIEKVTPFKRSITKSIEQTSKFTEANAESRTKKYTSCMPKTAVSPNFKAHQLGLARPK